MGPDGTQEILSRAESVSTRSTPHRYLAAGMSTLLLVSSRAQPVVDGFDGQDSGAGVYEWLGAVVKPGSGVGCWCSLLGPGNEQR